MPPVHFDPDAVASVANAAQGTASTPWYGHMLDQLFGGFTTLTIAIAGWFGAKAWAEKRKRPSMPSQTANSSLRTHDEVGEAVTDALLLKRVTDLEIAQVTFWRRYDDTVKVIDTLKERIQGLPTVIEARQSERNIIDAIHQTDMAAAERIAKHERDYHPRRGD